MAEMNVLDEIMEMNLLKPSRVLIAQRLGWLGTCAYSRCSIKRVTSVRSTEEITGRVPCE